MFKLWFKLFSLVVLFIFSEVLASHIVAVVDDIPVTNNEYEDRVKIDNFFNKTQISQSSTLHKQTLLKNLITDKIIEKKAKIVGLVITDPMINDAITSLEKNNNIDIGSLKKIMSENNLSYVAYRKMIYYQLIKQHIMQYIAKNTSISANEFNEIYNSDPTIYTNTDVEYKIFTTQSHYRDLLKIKQSMPNCQNFNVYKDKSKINISSVSAKFSDLPILDKSILSTLEINISSPILKQNDHYRFYLLCKKYNPQLTHEIRNNIYNSIGYSKLPLDAHKLIDEWYNDANVQIINYK